VHTGVVEHGGSSQLFFQQLFFFSWPGFGEVRTFVLAAMRVLLCIANLALATAWWATGA
jgi:hypothetical protein